MATEKDSAREQALAQLKGIEEMLARLEHAQILGTMSGETSTMHGLSRKDSLRVHTRRPYHVLHQLRKRSSVRVSHRHDVR